MLRVLPPPSLQKFCQSFGDYLRAGQDDNGVPSRVGRVYQELVFNNVMGFLNQCFPICKSILGEDWQRLGRCFFERYPTHSPYFSEIPMQFVDFLAKFDTPDAQSDWHRPKQEDYKLLVPDYLAELAHYEWLELYVDTLPNLQPKQVMTGVCLNPTLQNCYYRYAVHEIDTDGQATLADTFLAVLRYDDEVGFVALNAMTHFLLEFMKNSERVFDDQDKLLRAFAASIGYDDVEGLLGFGDELFLMLKSQFILLGDV